MGKLVYPSVGSFFQSVSPSVSQLQSVSLLLTHSIVQSILILAGELASFPIDQ